MDNILLKVRNLKKVYKDKKESKTVLKDIVFDIFEGEIFSLLGVNGAGKTTLSSIIASLIPKTSGDVFWKDKSIYENISEYRKIVGFCPQFQNLDMDLNLEENLIFAGRYFGLSKSEIKDRKNYLLEKFELQEYAKKELKILSGGYRQRFMIARSVMHRPKIVILDEPTVGLDPKLRRKLWRYILSLKDEGVTILLTTHYLEEADILSSRVCVIDEGEIKIIETPSNLKKQWKKKNLEDVFLHLIQERERDEK